MQQIVYIHGGNVLPDEETFLAYLKQCEYDPFEEKKKWRNWIKEELSVTHQMIIPTMPNAFNASYKAWKIWFEKIFSYLNDEGIVLIGHSLGTIFLLKYLSENTFPRSIKQLHLIGTVLDETDMPEYEDYLGDFSFDITTIPTIVKQVENIFIYHSKDDDCCPYSHAERLVNFLLEANFLTFENRGHFTEQSDFPELLKNIIG